MTTCSLVQRAVSQRWRLLRMCARQTWPDHLLPTEELWPSLPRGTRNASWRLSALRVQEEDERDHAPVVAPASRRPRGGCTRHGCCEEGVVALGVLMTGWQFRGGGRLGGWRAKQRRSPLRSRR